MIIFLEDLKLIPLIEAWFGMSYKGFDNTISDKIVKFNLSSFYSGFIDVTNLATIANSICYARSVHPDVFIDLFDFDIQYANAIINDDTTFISLMNIIRNSMNGNICIVLVHRDKYRDAVMESLIKLIQQRYNIQSWIINDVEDIEYLKDDSPNYIGLENYDYDSMRYDMLTISNGDYTSQ